MIIGKGSGGKINNANNFFFFFWPRSSRFRSLHFFFASTRNHTSMTTLVIVVATSARRFSWNVELTDKLFSSGDSWRTQAHNTIRKIHSYILIDAIHAKLNRTKRTGFKTRARKKKESWVLIKRRVKEIHSVPCIQVFARNCFFP